MKTESTDTVEVYSKYYEMDAKVTTIIWSIELTVRMLTYENGGRMIPCDIIELLSRPFPLTFSFSAHGNIYLILVSNILYKEIMSNLVYFCKMYFSYWKLKKKIVSQVIFFQMFFFY